MTVFAFRMAESADLAAIAEIYNEASSPITVCFKLVGEQTETLLTSQKASTAKAYDLAYVLIPATSKLTSSLTSVQVANPPMQQVRAFMVVCVFVNVTGFPLYVHLKEPAVNERWKSFCGLPPIDTHQFVAKCCFDTYM